MLGIAPPRNDANASTHAPLTLGSQLAGTGTQLKTDVMVEYIPQAKAKAPTTQIAMLMGRVIAKTRR